MTGYSKGAMVAWVVVLATLAVAVAAGGHAYYRQEARDLREARLDELAAIADLKIARISDWRREQLDDIRMNASGLFRILVLQGFDGPEGARRREEVLARMKAQQAVRGYQNMILADPDGGVLVSLDPRVTELDSFERRLVARTVASGEAVIDGMHRCSLCTQIHLDVATPILGDGQRAVGVLLHRNDPDARLFPMIQSWPTPSRSAETLLVRGDGDDVLLLNVLRHQKDPALTVRIPMSRTDVPAVAAVRGLTGTFEGLDYRGVPVVSRIQPVPGSPWFLVAKVDRDEILAEVRYRGVMTLALVALAMILVWVLGLAVYRTRRQRVYQRLLVAERERRLAQEEARITLYSIGDGVIATDVAGLVTRMNPVAEALTGWDEASARGLPLADVFPIINEDTRAQVQSPVQHVLRDGMVVGLANHTLLVARDGTERPIADSGAPIRDEEGRIAGVVLVFRDQTRERAAARALQEQERKYQTLFEHMAAGSCLDQVLFDDAGNAVDYRILEVNPAFEQILGFPRSQAVGALASELYGTGDVPFLDTYARVARTGQSATFEAFFPPTRKHLHITASCPAPGRFSTIFTDITPRKQAEEALRASEQRLRLLYEESPLGYHSLDADGVLRDVNPRWQQMTGYSRDEVLGRRFLEFLVPEDVDRFREHFPRFLATGIYQGAEFSLRCKDGKVAVMAVDGRVSRHPDGTFRQTHCVLRDVTEQRKLEAEKLRFEAVSRQQQKLEAIGTLASGVAHEINNPLNVILNYGELLLDDASDPGTVKKYVRNIIQEGERVALIVRNLLKFSRQDSEDHSPARMVDIVRSTLSLMQAVLRKDQIVLHADVPEDLPSVKCRSQQIQQVLMNLLTNARDALNQRYPKFSDDKVIRIMASAFEKGGIRWVRLSVEDHGGGIPPDVADRVFDPFFTTKPRDQGTGLGLSISYGIVREHHGELWFQTVPDQGTTFHVDLRVDNGWSLRGPAGQIEPSA